MKKTIYLLFGLLIFIGCEKPKETNLTFNITHTVENVSLVIGTGCGNGGECLPDHSCCMGGDLVPYTNAAGQKYNVQKLEYIISNIQLHSESEIVLLKDMHHVNLSDPSSLFFTYEDIPNNRYTSISFQMGLDSSKNIIENYINDPIYTSMEWPEMIINNTLYPGGYHYMKIEGDFDTITKGYATHTGPTMGTDYSFTYTKNINLLVDDELGDINGYMNMEMNNWYNNPNIINIESGIMMNSMIQNQLKENGENDVFSIEIE